MTGPHAPGCPGSGLAPFMCTCGARAANGNPARASIGGPVEPCALCGHAPARHIPGPLAGGCRERVAYSPSDGPTLCGCPGTRPVYRLEEGGSIPGYILCEPCIDGTADPAYARACIIARDDSAHCEGCDYHADPACGPGHWCDAAEPRCDCGHPGYDGHDMRSVPPACMAPGCPCGNDPDETATWAERAWSAAVQSGDDTARRAALAAYRAALVACRAAARAVSGYTVRGDR